MPHISSAVNTSLPGRTGAEWKESSAWKRILALVSEGRFPHACALVIDESFHLELSLEITRLLLCAKGNGEDGCRVCSAWSGERHPDLIWCGSPSQPPSIDMCRETIDSASYRPVLSTKRVIVVFSADRMLLPAGNSLLKLAEEPPEYVHLLFLLSDEKLFLPTLRSRSWTLSLPLHPSGERVRPPRTEEEWVRWIEQYSKSEVEEILALFGPWISSEIERQDFARAGTLERLRLLIQTKRLSKTMVLDLIVLVLKEGIVFEHSFSDFW
jgi:DNA polymerase-3 subunit delta'